MISTIVTRFCYRGAAFIIAVILLYSSFKHINNQYYYLSVIHSYQIVPVEYTPYATAFATYLQITIAVALLLGKEVRPALLGSSILFTTFLAAQMSVMYRNMKITCGCFGPSHTMDVVAASIVICTTCLTLSIMGFVMGCLAPGIPVPSRSTGPSEGVQAMS